ncbi:hypothetical protein BDC45DRAFT_278010 [Circinella umbellata]|nr:hypothetical protein BDC45DRAFT_278010 [Circinella umbellata]
MEDGNTQAIFSEFQKAQNARPVRGVPNNRLMDGMSTSLTRKLDTMSRQELIDLRERNEKLLNNPGLMTTLPDKGEKLKKSIEQIDELLRKQDIADGMLGLSVSPPSSDTIRKRSVDQAMELADNATNSTSSLLATKTTEFQPKTRMMSMDESMKLQEAQQQQVKDEKIKRQLQALKPKAPRTSESLADDLR